jgi:cytochrome c2
MRPGTDDHPRAARGLFLAVLLGTLTGVLCLAGCNSGASVPPAAAPDGDPVRGRQMIERYGCASCHTIGGIRQPQGNVGPPLVGFGRRSYIAGTLPNNEANLVRWIMDPQQVQPGNAMPDLGVTADDALDITAYLYKDR